MSCFTPLVGFGAEAVRVDIGGLLAILQLPHQPLPLMVEEGQHPGHLVPGLGLEGLALLPQPLLPLAEDLAVLLHAGELSAQGLGLLLEAGPLGLQLPEEIPPVLLLVAPAPCPHGPAPAGAGPVGRRW